MKFKVRSCLILAVLLTLFLACRPKPEGPQPPEIIYGQEMCRACGMVIDDPRFAAATVLMNGEYLKFDDVGEMLTYHMNHPEAQVAAWFVHDYSSEKWMRGEQAIFVHSSSLQTPMGSGIAAFADKSEAEVFAAEHNGTIDNLDNRPPLKPAVGRTCAK